ncbi:DDE_superfamily endonuclease domain-containing protein [Hexamita inflata]|uniref:DDE superfamily endonuclease domain-containing protein n=1 Tax=Hexamita inflata TaxID=28002 RepID=A0AA86PBN0_9EUKA|nr:DDE superfamily endonuclease domain-containing protein [Hexamita inflata]
MKQLYLNVRSGLLQVNIDETHWKLGNLRKYGYMARGTQRQQLLKDPSLPVTAITAITGDGHKYCKVYIGTTIDSSLFNVFLSELIKHLLVNQCGRCVFFLDNCSIHKVGAERIIKAANHVCLFNAPYSPQMNGIEYFFGDWKNKIQCIRVTVEDIVLVKLCNLLVTAYGSFQPENIRAVLNHVETAIFPLVLRMENLDGRPLLAEQQDANQSEEYLDEEGEEEGEVIYE